MQWQRATRTGAGQLTALSADAPGDPAAGEGAMPDQELFNALVAQHAHAVLGVAAAIVGTADAEDAGQEAIVRAWRAWPMLREREAFRAWLLRITVNVCRDWQRGRFGTRRRLNQSLDEAETAAPLALLGADPGGSDHTAALDLRHAVNQLEDDLRLVVVLRYYAGMDATEIGVALGVPPATIRTRLRRALRLLRERLSGPRSHSAPRAPEGESHA